MNYWKRLDYTAYLADLCGPADPDGVQEALGKYPKKTSAAVQELRSRGLDITYVMIRHWAKLVRTKSSLQWSAAQIDAAAAYFADEGKLTPAGQMCLELNISYNQYQIALLEAGRKIDGMMGPGEASAYQMIVTPGVPGRGICGTVEFTAPVAEGKK